MNICSNLPKNIVQDLPLLLVDRHNPDHPESNMTTQQIIGHIEPNKFYKLDVEGLKITSTSSPIQQQQTLKQKFDGLIITGQWIDNNSNKVNHPLTILTNNKSNILGQNGKFLISDKTSLTIPVLPLDQLSYFGAKLYQFGDSLQFETNENLPVSIMNIGANYVEYYLLKSDHGGGCYLEYHDRPHLHMPLDPQNSVGALVLGKKSTVVDNQYELGAFQIPYGYAIYTPPNVIHNDCYLTGSYLVVYSVTSNYSTVILVEESTGEPVKVNIG